MDDNMPNYIELEQWDIIGERLEYLREKMGLSIGDLAENLGIDRNRMSKILKNERDATGPEIGRAAKFFKVHIGYFWAVQEVKLSVATLEMAKVFETRDSQGREDLLRLVNLFKGELDVIRIRGKD